MAIWLEASKIGQSLQAMDAAGLGANPAVVLTTQPEAQAETTVQQYLKGLTTQGFAAESQGVWLQTGRSLLVNHQGTTPHSAASLTKVATSLAALETWGTNHQFETTIRVNGPIQAGVLQGDLIVQGAGDPFFVWEEAIALGNDLNRLGIKQITGNLVITGTFWMNFEPDPIKAGQLLQQAMDQSRWSPEVAAQHQLLPPNTPKPQVTIAGTVRANPSTDFLDTSTRVVLRHQSLPLAQILKLMNIYSNNAIAEMLAYSLGGAQVVAERASQGAKVPLSEIQLVNGSGLGEANRISPRAVCAMFTAIQRYLSPWSPQQTGYTLADLFPVSGRDGGTLVSRQIPTSAIVKTGTLNTVSALAGILPTRDRGPVCFAILNYGDALEGFRQKQDQLLQAFTRQWGSPTQLPPILTPTMEAQQLYDSLGSRDRNSLIPLESGFTPTAQLR